MTVDRIEIELADARSPDLTNLVTALDDFLNKVCGVERNHGSPIDRLAHETRKCLSRGLPDKPLAVQGCRCSRMVPGR